MADVRWRVLALPSTFFSTYLRNSSLTVSVCLVSTTKKKTKKTRALLPHAPPLSRVTYR